jgi:hypothetical protein
MQCKPIAFFVSLLVCLTANAQSLSYYLPTNVTYNKSIPTPASVIGHEVGEWHVTHDKLVYYMRALAAAAPDRIKYEKLGTTYEGREQLALIITSSNNHKNLEQIRKQHVQLTNGTAAKVDGMPVVVWMGFSIHGNESSGSNASMLSAYYLAAAQGASVDSLLQHTVILLDPSFNPDGLNRFASWANTHKSITPVTDPAAREFNEIWPGGRFNHYWFDLNRDWLPAQHRESQHRLQLFHAWKPNILTDHHEMGSNATFFFQPGVPSRVNPNTPWQNQELTGAIAQFHAKFLDSIGSMYYTKEGFDDFYYGKGSTYPDINGSVGILFEQASSRGHAQETDNGVLTFPFTIRNQFTTTLSTLAAAQHLRTTLLQYQNNFYVQAMNDAKAAATKAYIIGDASDKGKTKAFVQMLLRHHIDVYEVGNSVKQDGLQFNVGNAYIVPTNQSQYRLIKTIFEKNTTYKDSLFYDVTAWTMPLAFGIPHASLGANYTTYMGKAVTQITPAEGKYLAVNNAVAYAFDWTEFEAPKVLQQLLHKGLKVKVATQQFQTNTAIGKKQFSYGSIVIPVQTQSMPHAAVQALLQQVATESNVTIYGLSTGFASDGIDLGSPSLATVKKPSVMMFGGNGTSPTDVGEIWHLLDTRFQLPVSIVDVERFNSINVSRYNVIIMPSGGYNTLDKAAQEKLKTWVSAGGTLIATEDATKWLANNGFTKVLFTSDETKRDTTANLPFYLRSDEMRAKEMTGSLFEATLDTTHPLCYGYTTSTVTVFKSNTLFMDQNNSPYDSPVMYTNNPLQSGYVFRAYKDKIKNSAVINIDNVGRGRIISMVDNLNFRAFWLGTSKLFMNAIFFGDVTRN